MVRLSHWAADHPGPMMWIAGLFALVLIAMVAVPTLAPETIPFLHLSLLILILYPLNILIQHLEELGKGEKLLLGSRE